jgi:hypothetical protein
MYGRTVMGLLYPVVIEIYFYFIMGFGYNDCFVTGAPYTNEGYGYGFASSGVHLMSNSVGLLVYDVMCTISRAPMLYYRSLRTTPTLPGRGYYPG